MRDPVTGPGDLLERDPATGVRSRRSQRGNMQPIILSHQIISASSPYNPAVTVRKKFSH